MIGEDKHKKGWRSAFADQQGLFGALLTIYESIESSGFGGGSLRGLYASFLDTAAELSDRPALRQVADSFRELHEQWGELAERVAPTGQEPFGRARELIDSLHEQVLDGGDAERAAARDTATELWRLRDSRDSSSLFDPSTFEGVLEELGRGVNALYESERKVVAELNTAIKS